MRMGREDGSFAGVDRYGSHVHRRASNPKLRGTTLHYTRHHALHHAKWHYRVPTHIEALMAFLSDVDLTLSSAHDAPETARCAGASGAD